MTLYANIEPFAWHLHLLRNMSECRGGRLQLAESELYVHIVEATYSSPKVFVGIWTLSVSKAIHQYLQKFDSLKIDSQLPWLSVHQQTQDDVFVAQFCSRQFINFLGRIRVKSVREISQILRSEL